jgi:hypothetical protein
MEFLELCKAEKVHNHPFEFHDRVRGGSKVADAYTTYMKAITGKDSHVTERNILLKKMIRVYAVGHSFENVAYTIFNQNIPFSHLISRSRNKKKIETKKGKRTFVEMKVIKPITPRSSRLIDCPEEKRLVTMLYNDNFSKIDKLEKAWNSFSGYQKFTQYSATLEKLKSLNSTLMKESTKFQSRLSLRRKCITEQVVRCKLNPEGEKSWSYKIFNIFSKHDWTKVPTDVDWFNKYCVLSLVDKAIRDQFYNELADVMHKQELNEFKQIKVVNNTVIKYFKDELMIAVWRAYWAQATKFQLSVEELVSTLLPQERKIIRNQNRFQILAESEEED